MEQVGRVEEKRPSSNVTSYLEVNNIRYQPSLVSGCQGKSCKTIGHSFFLLGFYDVLIPLSSG